jgi:catechol-2,3-dioxygenase
MTQSELQPASLPQLLSSATRLGHVQLTVADLERELAFYQHVLGSVNAIISLWYISYGGKEALALTRLESDLSFRQNRRKTDATGHCNSSISRRCCSMS